MEISGVDDFISAICWTWYFIATQCYNVKDDRLHQDNKSSILVENNGKASSINWKNHINIRYFFIVDRFKMVEVSVGWCPRQVMIGDYMTKPLQGDIFQKFREIIMGLIPAETLG